MWRIFSVDGFAIFSNRTVFCLTKTRLENDGLSEHHKFYPMNESTNVLLIVLILMNQSMYGDEMIKLRMEPADESILFR